MYPPSVLADIVFTLVQNEFEVYLVRDHVKMRKILKSNPDSLLFINIEEKLKETEWSQYIKDLMSDESTKKVGVGIVVYNHDLDLSRKYLMDFQLPCGFITLKLGAARSLEILLKTLEANEAKGRRKFVRAACCLGSTECDFKYEGMKVLCRTHDISSVGMSFSLETNYSIPIGAKLLDVRIALKEKRLFVNCVVVAKRMDEKLGEVLVALFEPASIDKTKKDKLYGIIHHLLQANIESAIQEKDA